MKDISMPKEDLEKAQAFFKEQARKATRPQVQVKCETCMDRGYLRIEKDGYPYVTKCSCYKKFELEAALNKLPPRYRNCTLVEKPEDGRRRLELPGRDPVSVASQRRARDECIEVKDLYIDAFINKQPHTLHGLMLHGKVGVGKTHLLGSLLSDLIHAGLFDVEFVEYNELFKLIRFTYSRDSPVSNEQLFNRFIRPSVLCIDDFGMPISGDHEWILDNIGFIINERYVNNRPTLLTSNYWVPIDEDKGDKKADNIYETRFSHETRAMNDEGNLLKARINYRLRSRIGEMCKPILLEGKDWRIKMSSRRELERKVRLNKKDKG